MKLINPNLLFSRYANGLTKLAKKVEEENFIIPQYKAGANGCEITFSDVIKPNPGLVVFKFIGSNCAVEIAVIPESDDVVFNIKSNSIITHESYHALNLILSMMLDDLGIESERKLRTSIAKVLRSSFDQFTVIKSFKRFSTDLTIKRLLSIADYLSTPGSDVGNLKTPTAWVDVNGNIIKIGAKYSTYITYDVKAGIVIINSAYSLSNSVAVNDEFDLLGIVKSIPKGGK